MIVEKPLVSVIVPVYNAEKYIRRCIDSIRNQTYEEIEIILVNDGSIDSSKRICEKYCEIDNRITLYNQKNSGPSAARNYGLEKAGGKFIQFVDSDDFIEPDITERLTKEMMNSKSSLVISSYKILREENEEVIIKDIKKISYKNMGRSEFFEKFFSFQSSGFINSLWNKLYDKDLIDKHKIKLNEDWDIGEDLAFNLDYFRFIVKVGFVSEPLYNYCIEKESDSLMSSYKNRYVEGLIERTENFKKFLIETNVFEKHKKSFLKNIPSLVHGMFINLFYQKNNMLPHEKLKKIDFILEWQEINEFLRLKLKMNSLPKKVFITMIKHKRKKAIYLYYWIFSRSKKHRNKTR